MDPRPPNSSTEEVLFLTKDADTRTVSVVEDRLNLCTMAESFQRTHNALRRFNRTAICTDALRRFNRTAMNQCSEQFQRRTATHNASQPFQPYGYAQCISAVSTVRLRTMHLSRFNRTALHNALSRFNRTAMHRFSEPFQRYGHAPMVSTVSTVRLRTMPLSRFNRTAMHRCSEQFQRRTAIRTVLWAVSNVRLCSDVLNRFNRTAMLRRSQPFQPYGYAPTFSAVSTVRLCTDALSSFNGVRLYVQCCGPFQPYGYAPTFSAVSTVRLCSDVLSRFNRTAMLRRSQPFQPYGYAPDALSSFNGVRLYVQCCGPFQPYGYAPTFSGRFNRTAMLRRSQPFQPYGYAPTFSAVSTVRLCSDVLSRFNRTATLRTTSHNALSRFNRTATLRRHEQFQPYRYALLKVLYIPNRACISTLVFFRTSFTIVYFITQGHATYAAVFICWGRSVCSQETARTGFWPWKHL